MRKQLLALPASLLLALSLAACSGGGSQSGDQSGGGKADASQTTAEACEQVEAGFVDISADVNEVGQSQSFDTQADAYLVMLPVMIDGLQALTNNIGNESVRLQMVDFTDSYKGMLTAYENGDQDEIDTAENGMVDALTTLTITCQAAYAPQSE